MSRTTLLACSLVLVGSLAHAQDVSKVEKIKKPVHVVNDSTKTIDKIFVATAKYDGRNGAGQLIFDKVALKPGGSTDVQIPMLRGECMMHLRAETTGGGELRAFDVDICSRNATAHLTLPGAK